MVFECRLLSFRMQMPRENRKKAGTQKPKSRCALTRGVFVQHGSPPGSLYTGLRIMIEKFTYEHMIRTKEYSP